MATTYLYLSKEDVDKDQSPEILVQFVKEALVEDKLKREVVHAACVSSSAGNGDYDTVLVSAEVDNKQGLSQEDDRLLLTLAQAFAQIHL